MKAREEARRACAPAHDPQSKGMAIYSEMGVMETSLDLGLFLELLWVRLFFLEACLRRSFSSITWRTHSRCRASFSRCISRTSASVRRGGDCIMMGDDEALELATLWLSSSKGSDRRRSSSERKEVARSSRSNSERDSRLGHEGNAHEVSRVRRLEGLMSMAADMALMELYELYEPNIVNVCVCGVDVMEGFFPDSGGCDDFMY